MQIKRVQYYSWQEADNAHKASVGRSRLMELTNAEVWPKCTLAKKARQAHPASLTWPQLQPAPRRLDDCRQGATSLQWSDEVQCTHRSSVQQRTLRQLQRTLCPALLHLPCDPPFLTTAHKILQLTHTLYYALFGEACKRVHDYVTLVLYFQCIQCSLHTISTLHFCPAAYFFRLGQLLAEKVHHYI